MSDDKGGPRPTLEETVKDVRSLWNKIRSDPKFKYYIVGGVIFLLPFALIYILLVLWIFSGGSSEPTEENFSRIRPGMSEQDVRDILGGEREYSDFKDSSHMEWESDAGKMIVSFKDGKVARKQFIDQSELRRLNEMEDSYRSRSDARPPPSTTFARASTTMPARKATARKASEETMESMKSAMRTVATKSLGGNTFYDYDDWIRVMGRPDETRRSGGGDFARWRYQCSDGVLVIEIQEELRRDFDAVYPMSVEMKAD